MEQFVYQLLLIYITSLRSAHGVLTLKIIRGINVEATFICNKTLTFTGSMNYIDVRRSSNFSPCFCLLYPEHGLEWPSMGTVRVIHYRQKIPYEVGTIGLLDIQKSDYSAAQIEYGLHENTRHAINISSGEPREFDASDYFIIEPLNLDLDLSCSPHGYFDPRRTTSAPSTHASTRSTKDTDTQVSTKSAGSEDNQGSNTSYVIIGSVVAGVVVIVILVVVIICLMRRAGVVCSKAERSTDKQKHTIDNNNAPDGTVSYVNAGNMKPGNDGEEPVEYAQVDVSLLSKRPMPEQNVSTADEETAALTYADLDFDKTNKSPEKVATIMGAENKEETDRSGIYVNKLRDDTSCGTESQHAADDEKDLSELYAKPMKKPTLKLV